MAAQRHKIPVHLETPDTFLLNMTARQTAVVGIGVALAYLILANSWQQPLLFGVALPGAVLVLVLALLVAFIRPKKRTLDVWAVVIVNFWLLPKYYAWRPLPPDSVTVSREARHAAEQAQDNDE